MIRSISLAGPGLSATLKTNRGDAAAEASHWARAQWEVVVAHGGSGKGR